MLVDREEGGVTGGSSGAPTKTPRTLTLHRRSSIRVGGCASVAIPTALPFPSRFQITCYSAAAPVPKYLANSKAREQTLRHRSWRLQGGHFAQIGVTSESHR